MEVRGLETLKTFAELQTLEEGVKRKISYAKMNGQIQEYRRLHEEDLDNIHIDMRFVILQCEVTEEFANSKEWLELRDNVRNILSPINGKSYCSAVFNRYGNRVVACIYIEYGLYWKSNTSMIVNLVRGIKRREEVIYHFLTSMTGKANNMIWTTIKKVI